MAGSGSDKEISVDRIRFRDIEKYYGHLMQGIWNPDNDVPVKAKLLVDYFFKNHMENTDLIIKHHKEIAEFSKNSSFQDHIRENHELVDALQYRSRYESEGLDEEPLRNLLKIKMQFQRTTDGIGFWEEICNQWEEFLRENAWSSQPTKKEIMAEVEAIRQSL